METAKTGPMDQINFPTPPYFDPAELREEFSGYWREGRGQPFATQSARRSPAQRAEAEMLATRRRRFCCARATAGLARRPYCHVSGQTHQAHLRLLHQASVSRPKPIGGGAYGDRRDRRIWPRNAGAVIRYRSSCFCSRISKRPGAEGTVAIPFSISFGTLASRLATQPAQWTRP